MKAHRARVVPVGIALCALVVSGCSNGTTASAPASRTTTASATGSPAGADRPPPAVPGDEVRARSGGYTVVPPEGWVEATGRANGVAGIELVLLSSKKVAGFANNLVVTAVDGDRSVLQSELAKGRQQLAAAGRTVSSAQDKTVAGSPAVGFTTTFEQQGIPVRARSYGVQRSGRVYLLTLSSSQDDATHAMAEFDALLATWAWT